MGVDSAFAAVGARGDLIQLGRLIAVAHKHFFGGIEQAGLGFLGPKLLFAHDLHDGCTH